MFEGSFEGVSRMYQGSFKGVLRKIEGCSESPLRVIQGIHCHIWSYMVIHSPTYSYIGIHSHRGNLLKSVPWHLLGEISKIQQIRHVLVIKWSNSTPR